MCLQARDADRWRDLATTVLEERWRAEERKEVLGEEWRIISRILDRILLVIFMVSRKVLSEKNIF